VATFIDDFNRADAADLGPNWTTIIATHTIVANQAAAPGAVTYVNVWATSAATADCFSQATLTGFGGTNMAVIARCDGTDSNWYRLTYNGTTLQLSKRVAGTITALGAAHTVTLVAGDVIKITAVGSAIKGYRNGVEVCSATDTALPGGSTQRKVGIRSFGSAAVRFDDWSGGDVTASGDKTIVGVLSSLTLTAPAGSVATTSAGNVTVAGPAAALTLTAPAGTVAATSPDVTVVLVDPNYGEGGYGAGYYGGVPGLILTAPAGTVVATRNATVVGPAAALTVAAPAGTVTADSVTNVTVSGPVSALTLAALAGAVTTTRNVTIAGAPGTVTLTSPAGSVVIGGALVRGSIRQVSVAHATIREVPA
jgi:hypothetical protein